MIIFFPILLIETLQSGDGTSITLLLDSAVTDLDDLKVSYSGTSVVDASSANSSAGNALDHLQIG